MSTADPKPRLSLEDRLFYALVGIIVLVVIYPMVFVVVSALFSGSGTIVRAAQPAPEPEVNLHSVSGIINYLHGPGVERLVKDGGIPVISAIVFAETGLLVGFFLPGDTMLFLAGVAAGTGFFSILQLLGSLALAAVTGNQVGYFLGYKAGPAIFCREDGYFFKKAYAVRAHDFFVKNGIFAIVLARFIPILRTFVPFIAGVAKMTYWKYLAVDCLGGPTWITAIVGLGYVLGKNAQPYLGIILPAILIASISPLIFAVGRQFLMRRKTFPA
jgi:membrane-associated protein